MYNSYAKIAGTKYCQQGITSRSWGGVDRLLDHERRRRTWCYNRTTARLADDFRFQSMGINKQWGVRVAMNCAKLPLDKF